MFFDAKALDVEPLLAFVLALNHDGIFVRNPISANAILFWIIYMYQLRWNLS
jgi:hypothetical protein